MIEVLWWEARPTLTCSLPWRFNNPSVLHIRVIVYILVVIVCYKPARHQAFPYL